MVKNSGCPGDSDRANRNDGKDFSGEENGSEPVPTRESRVRSGFWYVSNQSRSATQTPPATPLNDQTPPESFDVEPAGVSVCAVLTPSG